MRSGINFHGAWSFMNPQLRADTLDRIAAMRLDHVRLDFACATLEPTQGNYDWVKLDQIIGEIHARGLKTLLMLYWPPQWASGVAGKSGQYPDGRQFGALLGQVGKRYGDKLLAVEMWNEPDLDTFWPSRDPAQFAAMIKAAYPVAKLVAPDVSFILGAPTYLGLASNWFDRLLAAGIVGNYDGVAIHPYMSPANMPPDGNSSGNDRKWSIVGIMDVRAKFAANGDPDVKLWATEFGWSTHQNVGTVANHKRGVSNDQQAAYLSRAFTLMESLGIESATAYTDRDMPLTDVHEASFGILGKPAEAAIEKALRPDPLEKLKADYARLEAIQAQTVKERDAANARVAALEADRVQSLQTMTSLQSAISLLRARVKSHAEALIKDAS